jgi:hypothetical protein
MRKGKGSHSGKAKKVLDRYQKRELECMQIFMGLLDDKQKEGEDHAVVYMT